MSSGRTRYSTREEGEESQRDTTGERGGEEVDWWTDHNMEGSIAGASTSFESPIPPPEFTCDHLERVLQERIYSSKDQGFALESLYDEMLRRITAYNAASVKNHIESTWSLQ